LTANIIDMDSCRKIMKNYSSEEIALTYDERQIGIEHLYKKHRKIGILVELTKNELRQLLDKHKKSKEDLENFIKKTSKDGI
jgi:hypothetical protein